MITHADQITGKKGEALREHLGDVIRNRRLNALVRDLDLELAPADLEAQSWDRDLVHTLFDSLEFRVLRDRLLESWDVQDATLVDDSGFELDGVRLGAGEVDGWLDDPRRPADPHRRHRAGRAGAPAPARCAASRWPRPTARPPGSTPPRSRPRTTPR